MKTSNQSNTTINVTLVILSLALIGGGIYSYMRMNELAMRIDNLSNNLTDLSQTFASTSDDILLRIDLTRKSLSDDISTQKQNVGNIQQQLGGVQGQVGSLSGTLGNLQKLAQTDPELLKKYSKAYFLNENYVPSRLAEIPLDYQYSDKKQLLIQTNVLPKLQSMIDAASSTGVKLYTSSAYRSFDEQRALKGDYTVVYGAGTANSFAADQGYSEHQLGTAVDMITSGIGGDLDSFEKTAAYQWMLKNAHKYGFTLSYPKNNSFYVYEPWHWRYVGIKLATTLHDQGKSFYDLDQRTIDTYLINIFD